MDDNHDPTMGRYVRDNPWRALLGSVGVGFVVGRMLLSQRGRERPTTLSSNGHSHSGVAALALSQFFDDEINAAIGSVLEAAWSEARRMVPTGMVQPADRLFDRFNHKLTGMPSRGPIQLTIKKPPIT